MLQIISVSDYCNKLFHIPVIDVRSPAEFQQGHIPNAINIPLFSNEERVIVGTTYKQQSKEKAIEIGYEFVEPKLALFLEKCTHKKTNDGIVIHCWRGGMRSQSFAEHLVKNGFKNVYLIQGGYKTFRTLVLQTFTENYTLTVLGGYTGSGKTEILHELEKMGEQVIDLEKFANHKGSAFGGFDHIPQPTSEQFENNIFWKWKKLDLTKNIWIEDESRNIGNALLPANLYQNIRSQKTIFVDIPRKERAKFLVEGYSHYSHKDLADAISRITKKIGGLNSQQALNALQNKKYHQVVELVLHYYDKRYLIGLQKRKAENVTKLELKSTHHQQNAIQLIELIKDNGRKN